MSLLLICNNNNPPTYMALSTDIVDNRIDGTDVIGATVYITDTRRWYIVDSDYTLKEYVFVNRLSGDYATLTAGGKQCLVSASEFHFHVHNGTLWSASFLETGILAGATIDISCSTGQNEVHISTQHLSLGTSKIGYFAGGTLSGGTTIPIINHDFSVLSGVGFPDVEFKLRPTISVEGILFRETLIPAGDHKSSGATSPFSNEFIVPENTTFYMRFTNLDGNDSMWNVITDFYEH